MSNAKLMTPLFYQGNFNAGGKKMRAILVREVSNGTDTYRLWRRDGKPDRQYPQGEGDDYILYVELHGYLASLRTTDFYLIDRCGFPSAVTALYGDKDQRAQYFDGLRWSGGDEAVLEALKREEEKIQELGRDPAHQADYIKAILDKHVSTYRAARQNGGETFPDFVGALMLGELSECRELSAIYQGKSREREQKRRAKAVAEDRAYCEERNRLAEDQVQDAIRIIRGGGVLQNDTVEFYRSRHDSSACSIILCLMRRYQVDVPLRTQGWINNKLASATIADGRCSHLRFWGRKRDRASRRFVDCMNTLTRAVLAEQENVCSTPGPPPP